MAARSYGSQPKKRRGILYRVPRIRSWLTVFLAILFYLESGTIFLLLFPDSVALASVSGSLLSGIMFALLFHERKFHLTVPGRRGKPAVYIGWCLFFFVAAIALEYLFYFLNSRISDPGMEARASAIENYDAVLFAIFAVFIAPFLEEVLMRLFCYGVLRSSCAKSTAVLGSALLFGAIHGTMTHMVVATVLGCILAFSYEATGRWFIPVAGHYIYNTVVMFLFTDDMLQATNSMPFMLFDVLLVSVLLFTSGYAAWISGRKEKE